MQAQQIDKPICRTADQSSDFPGELDWTHGDAWFALDLDVLERVQFSDPKGQLSLIRNLFRDLARDLGYANNQLRLVMYQAPKN